MALELTLEERIRLGIAWLDAYGPKGWRRKITAAIKADRFYLGSPSHCVLGELYGDYCTGIEKLQISDGYAIGFDKDYQGTDDYVTMTREWKRLYKLGQRRARGLK